MAESFALAVKDQVAGRTRKPKKVSQVKQDEAILQEARDRWNRCDEAEDEQRKSILGAKKFRAGDQWPVAIRMQREGAQAIQGQAAQPPRPCLTIDRLSQPVRQISNTIKAANFAIDVHPNGHGADDETAEIIKGYLRRVQNQARGESPVEWAADQAIEGGIGWFRIRTDYVEEAPDQPGEGFLDQELRLERITNNLSVYDDPSAMKPTRADSLFRFITEDLNKDEFKSRWPKADVTGIEDFCATGDMKGWVSDDSVRIAEYWRVTFTDEKWARINGQVTKVAEFPDEVPATDRRVVRRPKVEGYKISAVEILERWEWVGSRLPHVPVLGEELNVDGKPVLRGVIQEGMDAQRMINYSYSAAIEDAALAVKAKIMVPAEGINGLEAFWTSANKNNYGYLPYNQWDEMGRPINPPTVPPVASSLPAHVELMHISEEGVKATTGIYDPGLGKQNATEKSGKAIQALQGQSDLGSSNYPNNVSRALIYAGELMVEIMPKITRPGQILQILGMDDEPEQVMVGQAYQPGPNGQPQPAPLQGKDDPNFQKGLHKFYDLNAGRYAVTVAVGKATSTKREEGAAALGELIPHLMPEQQAVVMPDYVEQLSFPGAHRIAEKLRKALPPGLQEQEEGQEDPRIQQMQQQLMQMQQLIESKQIEEQAKQQAGLQEVQMKAQVDLQSVQAKEAAENQRTVLKVQADERAQALDNLVKLAIAEINAQTALSKVHAEQVRSELGFAHEHAEGDAEREHQSGEAERARATDSDEAERERQFQASQPTESA